LKGEVMTGENVKDELCRTVEALAASEKKFRQFFNNAPMGIFRTTLEGKLIVLNRTMSKMFGYDSPKECLAEINKQSVDVVLYVDPQRRQQVIKEVCKETSCWHKFENEYRKKDGTIFIGRLSYRSVIDEDTGERVFEGFVEDITDSRKILNELSRVYHMCEESQNALVLINKSGIIVYANKAVLEIVGAPVWATLDKYAIGQKLTPFVSFDSPTTLGDVCRIVEEQGKWLGSAYAECVHSNKGKVPIDIMFSRIRNGGGEPYIVASFYDASEYRRYEDKIRLQSQMYEEMLADMQTLVANMSCLNARTQERIGTQEKRYLEVTKDLKDILGRKVGG
jgi:PAS domain S-box-containing protein